NVCGRVRRGMARFKLVRQILLCHLCVQAQTAFNIRFAPEKVRRYRCQIRHIAQLVRWKDEGTPKWRPEVCYKPDHPIHELHQARYARQSHAHHVQLPKGPRILYECCLGDSFAH
ncbi:PIPO, partial [Beet mosaic virus]